jgi:hypothetical protein
MTSQGTAHGRFARGIQNGNVRQAEMAAREMGGLSLVDALSLCELLAGPDPERRARCVPVVAAVHRRAFAAAR